MTLRSLSAKKSVTICLSERKKKLDKPKHITHFNNARSPASPNDLSSVSFMFDLVLDRLDVRTDNYCLCDL